MTDAQKFMLKPFHVTAKRWQPEEAADVLHWLDAKGVSYRRDADQLHLLGSTTVAEPGWRVVCRDDGYVFALPPERFDESYFPAGTMSAPIEVRRVARDWAEQHGHQPPDDRLVNLVYVLARADAATEIRDALASDIADPDVASGEAIWEQGGYRNGLRYAAEIAEVD